jgi:hypothetical protein
MTQQYPPPQPPQFGQPHPEWSPQASPPVKRNGFGITAVALSLVGLVFCLMPITGFLGFALGLLALLFAVLAFGRMRRGQATKGLTITALVLALVTAVAGFASMKMFFDIVDGFGKSDSPPAAVSGAAPQQGGSADTPGSDFTVGQAVDRDGLQITAEKLRKVKPQFGDRQVCTKVSYKNAGGEEVSFNMFDWKIQNPSGVQLSATMAGSGGLQSGKLAPGGTVSGDVCATDPGGKGDYLVINEAFFEDPIRWKATL